MGHSLLRQLLVRVILLASTPGPPSFVLQAGASNAKSSCSLYEGAVGVVCFHGNEVTLAMTNSETSWLIEFYSSWCGHCQHFAPTWKALAQDITNWSQVVRIGAVDCSVQENRDACTAFSVAAYPTIRMFQPLSSSPQDEKKQYRGRRAMKDILKGVVDHIESAEQRPLHWPNLQPLVSDKLLGLPSAAWIPTVLVFAADDSYMGKKLILDFSTLKGVVINSVSQGNSALVKHYSILELPSVVIELNKEDYRVIAGSTFEDPRKEFGKQIAYHLESAGLIKTTSLEREGAMREVGGIRRERDKGMRVTQQSRTKSNRVNTTDLMGAISYALRREVSLHSIISGSAFTSLLRFVHLLESAFRVAYPAISVNLWLVRTKLELKQKAGFMLSRDWNRLLETKLDPLLFPKKPDWGSCLGSQPHYRGYPCSLWTLMHTVTILTLPVKFRVRHVPAKHRICSKDALYIISSFVKNFFSCEYCREHFTVMAHSLSEGVVLYNGDAVLWLWEAHNTVSKRLKKDTTSDPFYPKTLFPSYHTCPYCYVHTSESSLVTPESADYLLRSGWNNTGFSPGESLVEPKPNESRESQHHSRPQFTWNRTAVLLFLWNFYHLNRTDVTMTSDVLYAAWPKKALTNEYYSRVSGDLGMNGYDLGLWLVCYMMCGLFLGMAAFWLLRKRKLRHFLWV